MAGEVRQRWVDETTGLVSREAFVGEETYRQEVERIFGRCWVLLAHESEIPQQGDFVVRRLGGAPVIVVRDGEIRAHLNSCRHRGTEVCRADAGNVRHFVCPYHGWSYRLDGSLLTIRKFAADPFTADDLVSFGTMTSPVAALLRACVHGRLNIVISGGTGSGKTTTLNVLSSFVPENERILTIEDAAELQLRQDHVLRLEARPPNMEGRGAVTIRELVRNALRMRPDRIIVGEVRDGAALDMLQAMNPGHDGSITTVHANTPRDALARLETMVLMAGVDLPLKPREGPAFKFEPGKLYPAMFPNGMQADSARRVSR